MPGMQGRSQVGGMWEATYQYIYRTSKFLSLPYSLINKILIKILIYLMFN